MAIEVKDSFMMGTENGPGGPRRVVQYDLWVGGALLRLKTKEEVIAFAEWVRTSGDYMEDIGQQANGWVYDEPIDISNTKFVPHSTGG